MTRVTDRELELQAEVDRLCGALFTAQQEIDRLRKALDDTCNDYTALNERFLKEQESGALLLRTSKRYFEKLAKAREGVKWVQHLFRSATTIDVDIAFDELLKEIGE